MKNKGFTLIELLAVLVILAVVALIAFPVITGIIEKTKKSAALRSIEGYVEAANNAAVIYDVDNNKGIGITDTKHIFTSSSDTTEFSKIKAKGTLPTYSYIDFNTKTKAVSEGHFCISGYSVIYENNQARISDNNYCGDEENVEVIIIPKDEEGSCVNAQAASDIPLFKYEATGEDNDYVYYCDNGEWVAWKKANLRWDGVLYNAGSINSEHFGSFTGNQYPSDSHPINGYNFAASRISIGTYQINPPVTNVKVLTSNISFPTERWNYMVFAVSGQWTTNYGGGNSNLVVNLYEGATKIASKTLASWSNYQTWENKAQSGTINESLVKVDLSSLHNRTIDKIEIVATSNLARSDANTGDLIYSTYHINRIYMEK